MNSTTFSALADPNRFRIVELLRERPLRVSDLVDTLQLRQPQVSKHLKVLAEAGLVAMTPQANQRIYELAPDRFREIDTWLAKYRSLWDQRLDRLEEFLRKAKQKGSTR